MDATELWVDNFINGLNWGNDDNKINWNFMFLPECG